MTTDTDVCVFFLMAAVDIPIQLYFTMFNGPFYNRSKNRAGIQNRVLSTLEVIGEISKNYAAPELIMALTSAGVCYSYWSKAVNQ